MNRTLGVTPEERAKAVSEHFSTLPPEQRAELEVIVVSAIRRALVQELRGSLRIVEPLYMKLCDTDRDYIRFDVYRQWLLDVQMRIAKYGDEVALKATSVLKK